MKQDIKALTPRAISELVASCGLPSFRGKQISEWLYKRGAQSFGDMTNLPLSLRETLTDQYDLHSGRIINRQISSDGTRKYVIAFHDDVCVETVAMPSCASDSHTKLSLCISSQVGCPMACSFCATGKEGFTRNLTIGEIIDQIHLAQTDIGLAASSLVVMGQGEPFLNYNNLIDALHIINSPQFIGIGARHITVSTCGIIKGIQSFSTLKEQFTLAVSLHSAVQETRDVLMPGVISQPLPTLRRTLEAYVHATGRRVSLEYAMIRGINDSQEELEALVSFTKGLFCHINLIPLNNIPESPFIPSSNKTVQLWQNTLKKHGVETTIRNSRGADIAGACGQLKNSIS